MASSDSIAAQAAAKQFWDSAVSTFSISPELSRTYVQQMLLTLHEGNLPVPQDFKSAFCWKCLSIFIPGQTVRVEIRSCKKHPNCKKIAYNCLCCGFVQHQNVNRSKDIPEIVPQPQSSKPMSRANQQRRKLMSSIFNQ